MIFVCDRCSRRYSVPDEKVQGRQFRVTCRQCGAILVVRPVAGGGQAEVTSAPAPVAAATRPEVQAPAAPPPAAAAPAPRAQPAPLPPVATPPPEWPPPPQWPDEQPPQAPPRAPVAASSREAWTHLSPAVPPRPAPPPPEEAAPTGRALSDAELAWLMTSSPDVGEAPSAPRDVIGPEVEPPEAEGEEPAGAAEPEGAAVPARGRRRLAVAGAGLGLAVAVAAALAWQLRKPAHPPVAVAPPAPPPVAVAPPPAPPPAAAEPAAAPAPPAPPQQATAPAEEAAAPPPDAAQARPHGKKAQFEPEAIALRRVKPKKHLINRKDRAMLDLMGRKQDGTAPRSAEPVAVSSGPGLDAATVSRTVDDHAGAFSACLSRASKSGAPIPGRATLLVSVDPAGTVAGAWIAEAAVDRTPLGHCLSSAAKRMRFPAFDGDPMEVSVPMALEGR